jgi:hypothetical protein
MAVEAKEDDITKTYRRQITAFKLADPSCTRLRWQNWHSNWHSRVGNAHG